MKLELSSRKIEDSGRLTLEAFSKMASLPPGDTAAIAAPEAEAKAAPEGDFSSRKLEEMPPLNWAHRRSTQDSGPRMDFLRDHRRRILAVVIIGYKVFHGAASNAAAAPAEAVSTSNQPPASAEPPASATPARQRRAARRYRRAPGGGDASCAHAGSRHSTRHDHSAD